MFTWQTCSICIKSSEPLNLADLQSTSYKLHLIERRGATGRSDGGSDYLVAVDGYHPL